LGRISLPALSSNQKSQKQAPKTTDERHKTGSLPKQNQWNRSTNPLKSLNKINGIVQQNHWICYEKPPD
jgi:hypothetical protein